MLVKLKDNVEQPGFSVSENFLRSALGQSTKKQPGFPNHI